MNTIFFDSHFHLPQDSDLAKFQREAAASGVTWLMAVGGDYESAVQARCFAEISENIFFSAGVHPHEAESYLGKEDRFTEFLLDDSCRAVGEIGLDYFYENSVPASQIRIFEKFLDLSLTSGLPAIVHCRDANGSFRAYEDTVCLLSQFSEAGGRFVIHCFTGTVKWAEKFLELGGYIGITGIVTFPKADNVREIAVMVPADRLLLETDSPYLAPVPFRGKTNHPKNLPVIAEAVAAARGVETAEIAEISTTNALRFFANDASRLTAATRDSTPFSASSPFSVP
ncbi:MAG: TatD family hydrolase [Kiritimatiellaeota bacterium]|nr:TatD family hydrolase [Kiritimatiellota bacterium]